jgi:hypothetical protein
LWIADAATSAAAILGQRSSDILHFLERRAAGVGRTKSLLVPVPANSRFAARLAAAFFFAANGTSGLSGGNVGSRVAPRRRLGSGSFLAQLALSRIVLGLKPEKRIE